MIAIFHCKRDIYRGDTTLSKLFSPDGNLFCYFLEDVVRPYGIKDKHNTAIPETKGSDTYFMRVMKSPKYGEVVTIFTHMEGNVPVLEYGGIRFEYIRSHGGNRAEDTSGCPLANKNRDEKTMTAWGSMKSDFAKKVKELEEQGFDVRLKITNLPQKE